MNLRYLLEQQHADLTAEGVVTYPNPIDNYASGQANPLVFNSAEIHVFMNKSDRNYLSLQGEHECDISYGAGHTSFISEDKNQSASFFNNEDQSQTSSQFSSCLAGPSTRYSSHCSEMKNSTTRMNGTSAKFKSMSLGNEQGSVFNSTSHTFRGIFFFGT